MLIVVVWQVHKLWRICAVFLRRNAQEFEPWRAGGGRPDILISKRAGCQQLRDERQSIHILIFFERKSRQFSSGDVEINISGKLSFAARLQN